VFDHMTADFDRLVVIPTIGNKKFFLTFLDAKTQTVEFLYINKTNPALTFYFMINYALDLLTLCCQVDLKRPPYPIQINWLPGCRTYMIFCSFDHGLTENEWMKKFATAGIPRQLRQY